MIDPTLHSVNSNKAILTPLDPVVCAMWSGYCPQWLMFCLSPSPDKQTRSSLRSLLGLRLSKGVSAVNDRVLIAGNLRLKALLTLCAMRFALCSLVICVSLRLNLFRSPVVSSPWSVSLCALLYARFATPLNPLLRDCAGGPQDKGQASCYQ